MNNIRVFLSEIFQFLGVKFSIYLNKCVFVMGLRSVTVALPEFLHRLSRNVRTCAPSKSSDQPAEHSHNLIRIFPGPTLDFVYYNRLPI